MNKFFSSFKKILAIVLVMIMAIGSANVMAFAAEAEETFAIEGCEYNPVHYDAEENGDMMLINGAHRNDVRFDGLNNDLALREAAIEIRDNMIARNELFTVVIRSTNSNYSAVVSDAFKLAVSDELANSPVAGDYLAWHYGGYSFTGSASEENGIYEYKLNLKVPYYTTYEQEETVGAVVDYVLGRMNLENLTTYEKVKEIYDYICKVCNYNYDTNNNNYTKFSAYGAMIEKSAVCQGYSTLLYRMLEEIGIDSRIVTSPTHAWNIVNIDGKYYNVDVTWDDSYYDKGLDYKFFLKCQKHFDNHDRQAQFKTAEFNRKYVMADECMEVTLKNKAAQVVVEQTKINAIKSVANGFDVKWNKVVGAAGYQVQYATKNNFSNANVINLEGVNALSREVKTATTGTRYYVRVRAYKLVAGEKVYGNWCAVNSVVVEAKPAKVAVKSLKANTNGFDVIWNKAAGVAGYQIQYAKAANFLNASIVDVNGGNALNQHIAVDAGARYYVRVRAYKVVDNNIIYGDWGCAEVIVVK